MGKQKTNLLTVFPDRKNQKLADDSEIRITPRVTRQSSKGVLYTTCDYTGERVEYNNTPVKRKRASYSPPLLGAPKPKVAKQVQRLTQANMPRRIQLPRPPKRAQAVKAPLASSPPSTGLPDNALDLNAPSASSPSSNAPPDNASAMNAPLVTTPPTVVTTPVFKSPVNIPVTRMSPPNDAVGALSGSEHDDSVSDGFFEVVNLSDEILNFDEAIFDALDNTPENPDVDDSEEECARIRGLYSKEHALPVTFLGRCAIEYENFDFKYICEQITRLKCFNKKHEDLLIPLLKLGDRDVTIKLNTVNIKNFYKHEIIPAIENWDMLKKNPEKFYDKNEGQFEVYFENNCIVEVPLPPRPQIFPYQMRKMMIDSMTERIQEESKQRFEEEEERRLQEEAEEEAARRAHHDQMIREVQERYRAGLEQQARLHHQYPPNSSNTVPFVNPFVYQVNHNNFPHFPSMWFPQAVPTPPQHPNYYGNPAFPNQMYP